MHSLTENCRVLIQILLASVPKVQQFTVDADNGLAPNRRLAILRTNDNSTEWCIYTSLGPDVSVCPMYDS